MCISMQILFAATQLPQKLETSSQYSNQKSSHAIWVDFFQQSFTLLNVTFKLLACPQK